MKESSKSFLEAHFIILFIILGCCLKNITKSLTYKYDEPKYLIAFSRGA